MEEVYWIGGFGDRAYIGWIPVDVWRGVTQKEVDQCRLVGEEAQSLADKDQEQSDEDSSRETVEMPWWRPTKRRVSFDRGPQMDSLD